jgi:hypothetical protein
MQPEILRFLILARAHLRDCATGAIVRDDHADMQAIDRVLPDADWFELPEIEAPPRLRSIDLWAERVRLKF